MSRKVPPVLGFFALVASLSATPISCTGLITLQAYINLGTAGCTVEDKLFFGFFYVPTGGAPAATAIGVSAINNGSNIQGLAFGPFVVTSASDIGIGYNVMSLAGPTIGGAGLAIRGVGGSGSWAVAVTKAFCLGSIITSPTSCSDGISPASLLSAFVLPPDPGNGDSISFLPVGLIGVFEDIVLIPGSGPLAISFVDNQFTQIPEPASTALIGGGLVLLTGLWKYRRRS